MATDPRIILGINPPPDPGQQLNNALALKGNILKLKQEQQEFQQQNALKALFSQPDAFDDKGMATGNTLRKAFAISPDAGMKIAAAQSEIQQKQADISYKRTKSYQDLEKDVQQVIGDSAGTYKDARDSGLDDVAARAKAQRVLDDGYKSLNASGLGSEEQIHGMLPMEFEPQIFTARAETYKDRQNQELKREHDQMMFEEFGVRAQQGEERIKQGSERIGIDRERLQNTIAMHKSDLTPEAVEMAADQVLSGDKSALTNFGRGVQGSANLAAIRDRVAEKGAAMGVDGHDLAAMDLDFSERMGAARQIGRREGQLAVGTAAMAPLVQQAKDAFGKLSRSDFLPYNKLKNAVERQTANPDQRRAFVAAQAVINQWARNISPTGAMHVSDVARGEQMLSTVDGPEAAKAAMDQMALESRTEREAIKSGKSEAGIGATEHPPLSMLHEGQRTKFSNGQVWTLRNGRAVRLDQ